MKNPSLPHTFALAADATPALIDTLAVAAGYRARETIDLTGNGAIDRAIWTDETGSLTYARDAATGLQTLVVIGDIPASWPGILPLIDEAAIARLLSAADEADVLAGLQAAAITGATALAPLVAARTAELDPALADYILAYATAQPAAARPGPIAAPFSSIGGPREKLQLLRRIGKDGIAEAAGIVAGGLLDDDWEVRVTAMLAAARIGATGLVPAVARVTLPDSDEDGVIARERSALLALRDAALARLGAPRDRRLPPGFTEAIDGDYQRLPADLAPLAHALIEPLPDGIERPEIAGVVWTEEGPQQADGRLLVWVPPIPHWLGDDSITVGPPNPSRRVTPPRGFLIDAKPAGQGTFTEARAAAAAAGARLPTSDEWEMAARGPDGRRFAWGMNARSRLDLSPWGMAGIASGNGEWVEGNAPPGSGEIAGGRRLIVAARRTVVPEIDMNLFRFAYFA